MPSRAPHGARGLKQVVTVEGRVGASSRPTRGAWIETYLSVLRILYAAVAPHTGRVD